MNLYDKLDYNNTKYPNIAFRSLDSLKDIKRSSINCSSDHTNKTKKEISNSGANTSKKTWPYMNKLHRSVNSASKGNGIAVLSSTNHGNTSD